MLNWHEPPPCDAEPAGNLRQQRANLEVTSNRTFHLDGELLASLECGDGRAGAGDIGVVALAREVGAVIGERRGHVEVDLAASILRVVLCIRK